jgi:methylase of polypeptide subunit release factors
MRILTAIVDRQISELRDTFPWELLGNGKVVDIGGGSGHISIELARVRCTSLLLTLEMLTVLSRNTSLCDS